MEAAVPAPDSGSGRSQEQLPGQITDSFWRSLGYFSIYRLVVAAVFLVTFSLTRGAASLGSQNGEIFLWIAWTYLALSLAFLFVLWQVRQGFRLQLTLQVTCDMVALAGLMYASGGAKSGIVVMLMVVVAGAGLVGQGRLTFFFAALATLAVLAEQGLRSLNYGSESQDFLRTGVTSIGFFAIAAIARLLASRVVTNELLAYRRGVELADQIGINRQVIQDMDDGILVVNNAGQVCLHNPQAAALLAVQPLDGAHISAYSPDLADHLGRRHQGAESGDVLRLAGAGGAVLARFLTPAEGGNTLIYLQDLGRVQAEAQQIKLVALGRLTANIAHEIRNPLSAISHAAELLVDEQRAETRSRLVRIIGDNSSRLNRMVSEILELGRRDQALAETIRVDGFLRQFVEEYALNDAAVRRIVRLALDREIVVVFDRTHLYRVLENLLTNALRYASGAAASVVVETRQVESGNVELHVMDDGPGIAAGNRGKVFEPFFTTSSGGTGLGLYIAKELCEANGASLELMEGSGGGHFRITAKGGSCLSKLTAEGAMT